MRPIIFGEKPPRSLCFDFDGTIATSVKFPEIGEPIQEMIALIRKAHDLGIKIIIASCRWTPHDLNDETEAAEHLLKAKAWLDTNQVPYDVLEKKPFAEKYIDDLALHAHDFEGIDKAIDEIVAKQAPQDKPRASHKNEFACLMVDFPEDFARVLQTWGKDNIPPDCIYTDPEDPDGYGLEKHSHVTVAYGIDPKLDRNDVAFNLWYWMTPVAVRLGEISKFTSEKFDVIKVSVESEDLQALHSQLEMNIGLPGNIHEYKPHTTICYVKPGSCDHLLGLKPFEGEEFELSVFDYSPGMTSEDPNAHSKWDLMKLKQPTSALTASMIDYPHEGLPTDLWVRGEDGDYRLTPEAKVGITDAVMAMLEGEFKGATEHAWPVALYFQGSSATQFYTKDADIDIQVIVNMSEFLADNPQFKEFKGDKLIDELNEILEDHDKELKYGSHPIEARIRSEKKADDKLFLSEVDALYDLSTDTWIKKSKLIDSLNYSRQGTIGPALDSALSYARDWDLLLGEISRDLRELMVIKSYMDTEPSEKKKDYTKYKDRLFNRVVSNIKKMRTQRKAIRKGRRDAVLHKRHTKYDMINTHPDVVMMKLLVEWGYFQKILDLGHYAKTKDFTFDFPDVQTLMDILDEKVTGVVLEEPEEEEIAASDAPRGVIHGIAMGPLIFADKLTELHKAATAYVQEDPKFKDYLTNPTTAEALGALQQALSEARSEEEIRVAWGTYQPSISFEELQSRA